MMVWTPKDCWPLRPNQIGARVNSLEHSLWAVKAMLGINRYLKGLKKGLKASQRMELSKIRTSKLKPVRMAKVLLPSPRRSKLPF